MKISYRHIKKISKKEFLFAFLIMLSAYEIGHSSVVQAQVAAVRPSAFFTKTLRLGSYNEEVVLLKYILGKSPDTAFASLETPLASFGPKTQQAVIIFQEKYARDILLPLGLTRGTGVVASMTQKKLNELIQPLIQPNLAQPLVQPVVNPAVTSSTALLNNGSTKGYITQNPLRLFKTDKYQVAPGQSLILEGNGFSPTGNTVLIGENKVDNLPSGDSKHISVTVPTTVPFGMYTLTVVDNQGKKTLQSPVVRLLVTGNPQLPPAITEIYPRNPVYPSVITIRGTSFAPTNNTLITPFGTISELSSTNGTIMLDLKRFPSLAVLAADPELKNATPPVWMFVQNDHGVSMQAFDFTIKLTK